jgi:hypothetical protein
LSTDRCQPRTTSNSARTIAVAPQISSRPTRKRRHADAAAVALALDGDDRLLAPSVVHGDLQNPCHLAVGRAAAERRSLAPTTGCRRKPLTECQWVKASRGSVSARAARSSSCASRSAACSNASPGSIDAARQRDLSAVAAPAFPRGPSARCARARPRKQEAGGRRRAGCARSPPATSRRGRGDISGCAVRAGRGLASARRQVGDQGGKSTRN